MHDKTEHYEIYNGDCINELRDIEPESIDFSVFSPPFAALYVYSSKEGDMGNSSDYDDEFIVHYEFFTKALFPVIKPGRNVAIHISQVARTMSTHGHMGLYDIRGDVIKMMEGAGFIYYSEIAIDKNPQAIAIRTKSHKLMFVALERDQCQVAPANADYLLIFKKPGHNEVPVRSDISREEWIRLAHPVWYHIRETNVLNVTRARSANDERHICPLQLDLIDNAVRMWSNEGETVLSPFMGIGSEGYVSILQNRKFKGIEIKPEYYQTAKRNLDKAINDRHGQMDIFEILGM